jgi:hypothetical protein
MGGGLKVSPPPYEIFVKGYPFWNNGILEENFDFFG